MSDQILFKATKAEFRLITKIAKRARLMDEDGEVWKDFQDCLMDIEATHCNGTPLDLQKLLDFDDFNFGHDVFGIARHLNRETGKLENHFLPRCAA